MDSLEAVEKELNRLVAEERLTGEYRELIRPGILYSWRMNRRYFFIRCYN